MAALPVLGSAYLVVNGHDPIILYLSGVLSVSIVLGYLHRLRRKLNLIYRLGDPHQNEEAFRQLLDMGKQAVPLFLQALSVPLGTLKPIFMNLPVWDGNQARQLAAEGLGRLKAKEAVEPLIQVLDAPDKILRVKAVQALGEIGDARAVPALLELLHQPEPRLRSEVAQALGKLGDPRAIPELIPLLGEEVYMPKITGDYFHLAQGWVNEAAAKALRRLGQVDLVDSFVRVVLHRDKKALEKLKGTYERRVVDALMRALDSPINPTAANAAWALGELGASEALPKLWAKASLLGFADEQVKEACQQAIAKLKPLTTLPRPASASEVGKGTLPRPAKASDLDKDNLPRLPEAM